MRLTVLCPCRLPAAGAECSLCRTSPNKAGRAASAQPERNSFLPLDLSPSRTRRFTNLLLIPFRFGDSERFSQFMSEPKSTWKLTCYSDTGRISTTTNLQKHHDFCCNICLKEISPITHWMSPSWSISSTSCETSCCISGRDKLNPPCSKACCASSYRIAPVTHHTSQCNALLPIGATGCWKATCKAMAWQGSTYIACCHVYRAS